MNVQVQADETNEMKAFDFVLWCNASRKNMEKKKIEKESAVLFAFHAKRLTYNNERNNRTTMMIVRAE